MSKTVSVILAQSRCGPGLAQVKGEEIEVSLRDAAHMLAAEQIEMPAPGVVKAIAEFRALETRETAVARTAAAAETASQTAAAALQAAERAAEIADAAAAEADGAIAAAKAVAAKSKKA